MGESTPAWFALPALIAAASAILLAGVVLAKGSKHPWKRPIVAVLGACTLAQLGHGLSLINPWHVGGWPLMARWGELMVPPAILYVVLSFMHPEKTGSYRATRWQARAVLFGAMALGVGLSVMWQRPSRFDALPPPGSPGLSYHVVAVFFLLSFTIALARLEALLRAMPDPLRYQFKFVVIGMGALAGYGIYQTSKLLLIPVWTSTEVLSGGLATLLAVAIMAFGLGRNQLQEMASRVYVSQQMLYGSLTFLLVGGYLLLVGLLGEWVRYAGEPVTVALGRLAVLMALIGLVAVVCSRTARARLKHFLARHFYRSKYDYRMKWREVTETFRETDSSEAILDQFLSLLSRTFSAARISIWHWVEADRRFHQVRSINVEQAPPPIGEDHPVLRAMASTDAPVDVTPGSSEQDVHGREVRSFIDVTRAVLVVPIQVNGALMAFVTLSQELNGEAYQTDDRDLLRAISHHVGVLLSQAHMAEERQAAAEMEALHRFSAFCVHDLKNLASRLSLVAQNAEVHGRDPAFQQSAMHTVSTTVPKMMALIQKLSSKMMHPEAPESVHVEHVIQEAIGSSNGNAVGRIRIEGHHVPPVCVARDQLHHVLLNVLLNAREASEDQGEVTIRTEPRNGSVLITVADTGPGIPPSRLLTLFQPLRSEKAGGLGIGLYQCKQIIESYGGTICVNSTVNQGTRIQIELPAAREQEPTGTPITEGV